MKWTPDAILDREKLRAYLLEPFKDVPMPTEVYDQSQTWNEWHSTENFRRNLEGKHWSEVAFSGANSIELGILDDKSARYYTQAMLVNDYGFELPGTYPQPSFTYPVMVGHPTDLIRWYRRMRKVYTKPQLHSVGVYMWLWAGTGDPYICEAFMNNWRHILSDHVNLGSTRPDLSHIWKFSGNR